MTPGHDKARHVAETLKIYQRLEKQNLQSDEYKTPIKDAEKYWKNWLYDP
jgi:hypothetical protein